MKKSRQLTLGTGFISLLERLMLSPYSPLISEVVSNAEGPYIRTKNYDKKDLHNLRRKHPIRLLYKRILLQKPFKPSH
jgi:hypothetical protein